MQLILTFFSLPLVFFAYAQNCGDPTPKLPGGVFKDLKEFKNCDELARSPNAGTYCLTYHDGSDGCPCQCGNVKSNNNKPITSATPNPTAGPKGTAGPGGPDSAAAGCFHSSGTVLTESGRVTMADLVKMKNVKVQTINEKNELEFSPVEWWIHADPDEQMNFYSLVTESGHKLQLTDLHLIYVTPCDLSASASASGKRNPKFARNLKLGECVLVENSDGKLVPSPIVSANEIEMTGVFSPITGSGSIVVDGIAASVFSTIENESVQKLLFSYLMAAKNFIPNWFTGLEISDEIVHIPQIILHYMQMSKYFFA